MKRVALIISKFRRPSEGYFGIFILLLIGTLGYRIIEKWSFSDSFYMTVITITTVGFGETRPLSSLGRIFTVFLIFIGLSVAATFATTLTKKLFETQLKNYFGGNKLKKQITQMKDHYIVCGFGNIGKTICSIFKQYKIPFIVIECDKNTCEQAKRFGFLTVEGNATEDTILLYSGIKNAKGIVSVLNHDSDNLFVSLAARELNPDIFIISRGNEPYIEKRILRAGANIVVYPLKLGGEQIAHIVAQKYINDENFELENCPDGIMGYSMKLYHHFSTKPLTIKEALIKTKSLTALALRKSNGNKLDNPSLDIVVQKDDNILFLIKSSK